MGDRVAVMRKGELQQVAPPQELYDRPVNLFVGGFIGSPAMNMLEATLERRERDSWPSRRPAARARRRRRSTPGPRSSDYEGKDVDPRHPARGPRGRGARPRRAGRSAAAGQGRATRGARLGDHGALRRRRAAGADRRRPRARRRTSATSARCAGRGGARSTTMVGRFGARSQVSEGDASRWPSTPALCISSTPKRGSASTTDDEGKGSMMRHRLVRLSRSGSLSRSLRRGCGGDERRRLPGDGHERRGQRGVSGIDLGDGHLGRPRAEGVPGSARRVQGAEPGRRCQVHIGRRPARRRCSRRRSRAATRPTSRLAAAGTDEGLRARKASCKPIDFAKDDDRRTNFGQSMRSTSAPSTASSTASSSRPPTSRPSGTTSRLRRCRRRAADDLGRFLADAKTCKASGLPAYSIGGADGGRSPTCSRTSTSARPGRRSTTSWPTHEIPWTDQSVKDALTDDGARSSATRTTSPAGRRARCRPTSRRR